MSHRLTALAIVLGAILLTASFAALWVGVTDWMVAAAGGKQRMAAEALPRTARGWYELTGCVRHDLAVVVTAQGVVYRLGDPGTAPDDTDRTYTPIAAREDCDDDRPPQHLYALMEDWEGSNTTLGRVAPRRIAPPSVVAIVEGTIGPGVGDRANAKKARARMAADVPAAAELPLLRKGGLPRDKTVSIVTGAVGLHGFLLFALGARWMRRRARRQAAVQRGEVDEGEEQFFKTETLD